MTKKHVLMPFLIVVAFALAQCASPTPSPTAVPPTKAPPTSPPPTATQPPPTATLPPPTETAIPGIPAADAEKIIHDKFSVVDRNLALWNIQPGLGTVMIEYGNRLARIWFAANAGNWDMAKYQLDEAIEIQEVGETTRPKRAEPLKTFEDNYLKPLDEAILANDKAKAEEALNNTVAGCNKCHAASTGQVIADLKDAQNLLSPTYVAGN